MSAPPRVSALDPPLGRRDAAAAAILLALMVVMFWPLAAMRAVPIPNDLFSNDLMYAHVPFRALMAESLRAGHLPFWTPLVYSGYPLLADSATGTFFPLNWFFVWLPWPAALNLDLLLTFWLAAWCMYLYGRTLGLARGACLVAGVAFGLSGFFIGHVRHPNLSNAALLLPAMLALVEAALRTERRGYWLWLAPFVALQVFAGGPPVVYVTVVGLVAYVALRLIVFRERPAFSGRLALTHAGWAIGSLLLGAALAAVQVFPTAELTRVSERAAGLTRETAEVGALPVRDLLMFVYPYANGDPGRDTYGGRVYWENCGYLGLLPLLAGLVAIPWLWRPFQGRPGPDAVGAQGRRSRMVPLFTIAVVAGVVLALGPHTPLFSLARKALPGFAGLRFPQRFLLWVILALCVLAATALTQLVRRLGPRWGRLVAAAAVMLTFLDLYALQRRQVPVAPVGEWTRPPASAAFLQSGRMAGVRVFALGAEESFGTAYHSAGGWEGDLTPYLEQRVLLQPNSNALYDFASPAGYADLTPALPAQVWGSSLQKGLARVLMEQGMGRQGIAVSPALQRLLDGWSVGYVLSFAPLWGGDLVPVGRAGWALIYVNPTALPRARIASRARAGSDDAVMATLATGQWDPARSVLLDAPASQVARLGQGGEGRARITTNQPTRVIVQAETSGPGWLVLADTWYPGWRAEVDGRPARIYRANLCQRAVHLPAGRHRVTFRYQATAYRRGLMISLAALALWLAAVIVARGRRADR